MENTEHEAQDDFTATYSPEDNKLRLYSVYRLDKEDYEKVRAAGFRWAPKQELFVAPMWTPAREDFLLEMAGEIGDEDTSLIDRAEERADRFGDYSNKRAADAHSAHAAVKSITDHIPMGQPILVGHHSEKRARKDAERIENGMRKAVNMWETSKYWTYRAAGAIRHAKYKEQPAVRARRIKKIEAAKRKQEKIIKESRAFMNIWLHPSILTMGKAKYIGNYSHCSFKFTLEEYPREPPTSQYEGDMSLWGALDHGIIVAKQARNLHVPILERSIAWANRWISHYDNRLLYEKAMLESQGALDLLKPKKRPKQLPLLNYRAPDGIQIENVYHKGEFSLYPQVEMTKAQHKELYSGAKGVRTAEGTHRIRICSGHSARKFSEAINKDINNAKDETARFNIKHSSFSVFLTDSKVHPKPEPETTEKKEERKQKANDEQVKQMKERLASAKTYTPPERNKFDDLKDTLKQGVEVVAVNWLFITPKGIAQKMADYLDIEPGQRILEPNGGTGILIGACGGLWYGSGGEFVTVEINQGLCDRLEVEFPKTQVDCADFLGWLPDPKKTAFDRIIMNPPFEKAVDIKHIQHAFKMLVPGGRLVALCASGPRQQKAFMDIAEHWEDLPAGSFKDSGTNVNVALMVLTKPEPEKKKIVLEREQSNKPKGQQVSLF